MGFALLLRGYVSLHASAVAVQGSAIAFVGPAGAGKSTTAAALANFGYHVITEDVVTLRQIDNSFNVEPGYPCIRLWPASVAALYGTNADLPRLTPTWDKRFLDLTQKQYRFQNDPLQLRAIYLIDNRIDSANAPFINSISQPDALISLVANTYAQYLMNKEMRAREFNVLSRLLKTVTVRRLVPHSDPASITSLCETVIQDIDSQNLGNGAPKPQATSFHV
jgi:Serine kinase of the HPr protein, regulates carbohydrate metabolism